MRKSFVVLVLLMITACGHSRAQSVLGDTTRVYDTVADSDPFYLFFEPKPCIEPSTEDFSGRIQLQEYILSDTVTVYGVALTFMNQFNYPIYDNAVGIKALLMTPLGPSSYPRHYAMQPVDTVTLNRSNPHFCWFKYEDDCEEKAPLVVPCYEFYFDTPAQINQMTDTFYVGLERNDDAVSFLPRYYGGRYDNSLPAHCYYAPGAGSLIPGNDYFSRAEWYTQKLWGFAFPIIGFRCKPLSQYWVEQPVVGGQRVVRWRNAEEGTLYNVRLVGEDGSDTTFVTTDTTLVLPMVSDSVRYTVMLRKQCHYATSNYDTTVSSEWLSYIHFGTTILPPDTTTRDTVWRTVTGVSNNPAWGTVYGSGVYADSSVVELTATPFAGCDFDAWSDGNHFNPRLVFVVSDTTLVARFIGDDDTVGIAQATMEAFSLQPNPAHATVQIQLPEAAVGGSLSLCDIAGRELEVRTVEGSTMEWDVSALAAGAYIVKLVTAEGIATRRLLVE